MIYSDDLKLPYYKYIKDKKEFLKTNFLKNNSWSTKKIRNYYSSLNEVERDIFAHWFILCFDPKASRNKRFLEAVASVETEESEMLTDDFELIEIEKTEYNSFIDCIALLKKNDHLSSVSMIKLSIGLTKIFWPIYSQHTILDKLYRKKGYGEYIESITFQNKK